MIKNVANNVAQGKVQDYVKKSHNLEENEVKSEKTSQDVQKNCLSLTEQWKNGELDDGFYYINHELMGIIQAEYNANYNDWYNFGCDVELSNENIKEILAPVPSYEQWQSLNEILGSMSDTNKALAHRLNICKELLKECRDVVEFTKTIVNKHKWFDEILTKIDEVLK